MSRKGQAKEVRVPPDALKQFIERIFRHAGCRRSDARTIASCMVQTNLWGIDSHGVIRTPEYRERLIKGAVNARPRIQKLKSGGSFEVLDADNGAGFVGATAGMKRAIELAAETAISAVGVINSNHCGATALYARMAASQGMIGIAMSNVAPNMVMPGVKTPITGNNPIAVAIPTFAEFPFCLDISLSAVAGGKLLVAAKKGEEIPLGWDTYKEVNPTTDAKAGFDGYLLPMGGHKGFGLSLMVDLLCGVITGGAFQNHIKSMYRYPDDPSRTAHLMLVMNPLVLMSEEQLGERMREFVETLRETPVRRDTEILLPGELEYRSECKRRSDGIPLPSAVFEEITRIGNEIDRSMENE